MTSPTLHQPTHRPTDHEPAAAGTPRFGLPTATALVVGSIIGVGIFNLPGSLASYGPISLVAMLLTTVGAVALALMFARMSKRLPADGGPYAYSRVAFGNLTGFSNAWLYWVTAWAGNAAIVVGWVFYVQYFLSEYWTLAWTITIAGTTLDLLAISLCLVGLWLPAVINLSGLRNMGSFQLWTSIIKFVPLAIMSTVGLFYISSGNFTPFNTSGDTTVAAIGGAMALCLFSYLGVETASVAAARVRAPDTNVPRATIYGTLASAVVYLLSLVAVFGIVGATGLGESSAPFSTAFDAMWGGWASQAAAAAVIVSGFGALVGWTMICAEMPYAAAKDGVFPDRFAQLSRRDMPSFGIVASTGLASVVMIVSFWGNTGYDVFNVLVYMTGITAAIPYGFSALAQIKWRLADHRHIDGTRFLRDVVVAGIALVFSALFIWYSRMTGEPFLKEFSPFIMAGVAFLIGIPVYLRQRPSMTEPAPVPDYVE
jgi:basic amino acid/polyamine antiporter, APA family